MRNLIGTLILFFATNAHAVSLQWDASAGAEGYKLYCGADASVDGDGLLHPGESGISRGMICPTRQPLRKATLR